MRIYSVISIAQLEPDYGDNPYRRPRPIKPTAVINKNRLSNFYKIKKLLRKRIVRDKYEYLIK